MLDVEEERKQREVGRDINGTPGNRRTRGGKRQLEIVIETGMQGLPGRDAWHCVCSCPCPDPVEP